MCHKEVDGSKREEEDIRALKTNQLAMSDIAIMEEVLGPSYCCV